jgi:hypothetical protein
MPDSRQQIRLQQKLDAATRDKTVQKAVDRVLHRALAMTSTDDIRSVIEEMRDAWFDLGVDPVSTGITFIDEAQDSRRLFGTWGRGEAFYFGDVSIEALLDSGSKWHAPRGSRRRSAVIRSNKREMQTEFRKVARAVRGRDVAADFAKDVAANFTYPNYRHLFYYTGGWIGVDLPRELSKEEMSIGRRLAEAFDVAWRRLVELQEKEERAREAEISVALERVRSQALGMQESTDIAGVTETLFEQQQRLGLNPMTAHICLDEGDDLHEFAYSSSTDASLEKFGHRQIHLPKADLQNHPDFDLRDWEKGKERSDAYFDLEKVEQMISWSQETNAVEGGAAADGEGDGTLPSDHRLVPRLLPHGLRR